MVDWLIYWFMLPACIVITSVAVLTGISGTAILTPVLILVFPLVGVRGLPPAVAFGVALLTEFFGFTGGVVGYYRRGLVDFVTSSGLLVVAVPTVVVFILLSQSVDAVLLRGVYGGMMVLLAAYLAWTAPTNVRRSDLKALPDEVRRIPRRSESPVERLVRSRDGEEYRYRVCDVGRGRLITAVGAAMKGLVSVGLGEVEMPNLVKRCKVPLAVAAATSVFVTAVTDLAGSTASLAALAIGGGLAAVPWNLLVYTIPGAVLGGLLGVRFQGRISSKTTERSIAVLFAVVGVAFLATVLRA